MTEPVVALLIGLALIAAAVWLMWKLKNQGDAGSSYVPAPEVKPEPTPAADVDEEPTRTQLAQEALTGGRRRRRAWAQAQGFEFAKSDPALAEQWPDTLLGEGDSTVVRDVASGFFRGYPVHIGDIRGYTVLAMRRAEPSPVHVLFTSGGGLPHGLRRAERCDSEPFFAYTTDLRALERMMDERVQDGLIALQNVADHIEWEGRWHYIRISRKLDTSVWDQILPYQYHMVNAAMILPPMYTSVPLEFENADPTRALPGVNWTIDTASGRVEAPAPESNDRPAYIQSVPDEVEKVGVEEEGEDTPRPDITRPAQKIEFPVRANARTEGNIEDFSASHLAEDAEETIPVLGEDPGHINPSTAQRPHVRRTHDQDGPTIFTDLEADAEPERTEPVRAADALAHRRATPQGKHRKPDARHARADPIEAVEIVEAEVVDINHNKQRRDR